MQFLDATGVQLLWNAIKNKFAAKATTLAGYGITDAYTITAADGKFETIANVTAKVKNLQDQIDTITKDGETQKAIDTFNEVKTFLADYNTDDTLKSIIDAANTAAQKAADTALSSAKTYVDGRIGSIGALEDSNGGYDSKQTVKGYVDSVAQSAAQALAETNKTVAAIKTKTDTFTGASIDSDIADAKKAGTDAATAAANAQKTADAKQDPATTLAGYGITDAKVDGLTITLGSTSLTLNKDQFSVANNIATLNTMTESEVTALLV